MFFHKLIAALMICASACAAEDCKFWVNPSLPYVDLRQNLTTGLHSKATFWGLSPYISPSRFGGYSAYSGAGFYRETYAYQTNLSYRPSFTQNSGYLFDGSNDFLKVSNPTNFNFSYDSFSLSVWIKPLSISGNRTILDRRGVGIGSYVLFCSSNLVVIGLQNINNTINRNITNSTTISTGAWYHVCSVSDRSSEITYIYLNGVLDGSGSTTGIQETTNTNYPVIGSKSIPTGTLTNFHGFIANLIPIYRAISSNDVKIIMEKTRPR